MKCGTLDTPEKVWIDLEVNMAKDAFLSRLPAGAKSKAGKGKHL